MRGKFHEPALFGSWPGEQSHTNSLCQISVISCSAFLASSLSFLLFFLTKSTQPETGLCETALVLISRAIIYKIRLKLVKMDWLGKNILWLDIRMSEYLLQHDYHLLFIRELPEPHLNVFFLCFIFIFTSSFWNNCSNFKP